WGPAAVPQRSCSGGGARARATRSEPYAPGTTHGCCSSGAPAGTRTARRRTAAPSASPSERIGTELELHDLARGPFAPFDVEGRSGAVGRPQSLALPASIRIVDASVHPLGVEAHGIRHAE